MQVVIPYFNSENSCENPSQDIQILTVKNIAPDGGVPKSGGTHDKGELYQKDRHFHLARVKFFFHHDPLLRIRRPTAP